MIDKARIRALNELEPDPDGRFVLYWMQQSQRAHGNHALEHAIRRANELEQPIVAAFGLMDDYPEANARHYAFMLEGLAEAHTQLAERGIKLVVLHGQPDEVVLELANRASLIVCDCGYLRHQRAWRQTVAERAKKSVLQVESDVVVPVEVASDKSEFAARTLRPKIRKLLSRFDHAITETKPAHPSSSLDLESDFDISEPAVVLDELKIDRTVKPVERFTGGLSQARRLLRRFLTRALSGYADARNDPADPQCSNLSPYLHFGQISPLEIVQKVRASKNGSREDKQSFLEELIVRRELAVNFVFYEPDYDRFDCLPRWARETLRMHRDDQRPHRYTRKELEAADTHDPYWNAAMTEMLKTGYMHNYMRMYWGKKVLEWSNTPEYAYRTTLYLNNKYFLDGRDANSYANVAWIFGLHDRPWQERAVFGKVRYMNDRGLERKFDIDAYVAWVEQL